MSSGLGRIAAPTVCFAAIMFACSAGERLETPTEPRSPSGVLHTTSESDEDAGSALGRLDSGVKGSAEWLNAAWVGALHTRALTDFAPEGRMLLGASSKTKCQVILRFTESAVRQIQGDHGLFIDKSARALAENALRSTSRCRDVGPLSLMAFAAIAFANQEEYVYDPSHGDPVTGEYEPYVASIESALANGVAAGSAPAQIGASIDAIVQSASAIASPDLQVVYGAASLALESIDYWYAYYQSGGGGGGCESGCEEPMSMFFILADWRGVALSDAAGCGVGAWTARYLAGAGPVGWKIIAGSCAVFGIANSLAAL